MGRASRFQNHPVSVVVGGEEDKRLKDHFNDDLPLKMQHFDSPTDAKPYYRSVEVRY